LMRANARVFESGNPPLHVGRRLLPYFRRSRSLPSMSGIRASAVDVTRKKRWRWPRHVRVSPPSPSCQDPRALRPPGPSMKVETTQTLASSWHLHCHGSIRGYSSPDCYHARARQHRGNSAATAPPRGGNGDWRERDFLGEIERGMRGARERNSRRERELEGSRGGATERDGCALVYSFDMH
jgi:hypothetical protein